MAERDNARYFGPGYYELYRHLLLPREQTRAEAEFLVRRLLPHPPVRPRPSARPRPVQRWLDMPCGYGRHLRELRALAPDLALYGGDLNPEFLRERGLARAARVACCDMRRLPFAAGAFHTVLNLLNSFGYFPPPPGRRGGASEGDRAVLAEMARVLRPGGWLVMDLPNRRALLDIVRRQPLIRYCDAQRQAQERFSWDSGTQCLSNRTQWRWPGGAQTAGYRVRLYTPAQMRALLERAGFEIVEMMGDFGGGPFDPRQSDRMLILARRVKTGRA
jgi:SAM-dependent methyltransferase